MVTDRISFDQEKLELFAEISSKIELNAALPHFFSLNVLSILQPSYKSIDISDVLLSIFYRPYIDFWLGRKAVRV